MRLRIQRTRLGMHGLLLLSPVASCPLPVASSPLQLEATVIARSTPLARCQLDCVLDSHTHTERLSHTHLGNFHFVNTGEAVRHVTETLRLRWQLRLRPSPRLLTFLWKAASGTATPPPPPPPLIGQRSHPKRCAKRHWEIASAK